MDKPVRQRNHSRNLAISSEDQIETLQNRNKQDAKKKKPKVLPKRNEMKMPSHEQWVEKLLMQKKNHLRKVHELTPEEHKKALQTVAQMMNKFSLNSQRPQYYWRTVILESVDEQVNRLMIRQQELHKKVFQSDEIWPILLPHPGILSQRDKSQLVSKIDYSQRVCQKRQQKIQEVKDKVQNELSEESNILADLDDKSSQYVTKTYQYKVRQKEDFKEYYENGLQMFEKILKGLPSEAYNSLEGFNEANFVSYRTLDEDYYRSLDERNKGFSGCLKTDEQYADDMPFDSLFPELAQFFGYPQKQISQNYDLEKSEQEQLRQEEQMAKQQQNGENMQTLLLWEQEMLQKQKLIENQPKKYKYDNDILPLPEKHLNYLKESFTKEIKQKKSILMQMLHYNRYSKTTTNRWDYFFGLERFQEENDQNSDLIEDLSSHSLTHTISQSLKKKSSQNAAKRKGASVKNNPKVQNKREKYPIDYKEDENSWQNVDSDFEI